MGLPAVQLGRVQPGGPLVQHGGTGGGVIVVVAQTFREALCARLEAIPELAALVGTAIYPGALPMAHDLGRDGPALTYTVATYPRGHVLAGSDGTATARVQLSAWAYSEAVSDSIALALFTALDGAVNDTSWGNGTVAIVSCLQEDETDLPGEPKAGTDQWVYQVASDYSIKHRVSLPTHS